MSIDVRSRLVISDEALAEFCRKWKIERLELFGSALREDFTAESDIDFLYVTEKEAGWSLLDHVHAEEELRRLLGRQVDLVSKRAVEAGKNWIRRRNILGSSRVIYG
jgi:hypothetical protein